MDRKRALIVLGGAWHDFEGFASSTRELFPDWHFESTYDLRTLTTLDEGEWSLVISDTCFARYNDGRQEPGPFGMADDEVAGLKAWVRSGGAFLPFHSATVLGESSQALGELAGGAFVEHPEEFSFTVYPVFGSHPITDGIEAFAVHDEFYKERIIGQVDVHLIGIDRGTAYPLAWSKREGDGRVAHIGIGHSELVWNHPGYQALMRNTVAWLAGEDRA